MFSRFLETFVTWIALVAMCKAENLERTNLAPLSIVYTVYPYYNSDTLLGIVKPEEPVQVIDDVYPLGQQSSGPESRNPSNDENHDGTFDPNNRESLQNDSEESAPAHHKATSEITYWPPIQRGVVPRPRLARTAGLRPSVLKSNV